MKALITMALLALTLGLHAQSSTDSQRLNELKENILTRFDIENFILEQEQTREFSDKLGDSYPIGTNPLEWAKANIDKTGFKNYDEVVELFDKLTVTATNKTANNKDYYAFIERTSTSNDMELLDKAWEEVYKENPEKFERMTKLHEARLKGKI